MTHLVWLTSVFFKCPFGSFCLIYYRLSVSSIKSAFVVVVASLFYGMLTGCFFIEKSTFLKRQNQKVRRSMNALIRRSDEMQFSSSF